MHDGTLHSDSDDPDRVGENLAQRPTDHRADHISFNFVLDLDVVLQIVVDTEVDGLEGWRAY